jgi:signal transduction histidine kinase
LRNLSAEADIIAVSAQPALDFNDSQTAENILNTVQANHQIAAACIFNSKGEVFASYRRAEFANYEFPPPAPDGHRFVNNSLLLFHSVWSGNEDVGQIFLRFDLQSPWAALPHYAVIIGAISLVLLVVAVLVAALLQRVISIPILELANSARMVKEKKDFSIRAVKKSNDECGLLTDTFNDMLTTIESRDRDLQHELAERRRVEEALQQSTEQLSRYADELEERVAERTATLRENLTFLEAFCYSIAHDLRAPLRSMAGFANALREDYGHQLDQLGNDYITRIIGAATRMDNLIMDLLVFGRLSQIDVTFEFVDLNAELTKVLTLLSDEISAKRAEVQVEPKLPTVWANATVVEQVLTNLIFNAIKFSMPGVVP